MIKRLITALMVLLLLDINCIFAEEQPVRIDDPTYIASITGTRETEVGHLIITDFIYEGAHLISNLHGEITYDKSSLVLYRVVFSSALSKWKATFKTDVAGKITFDLNCTTSSEGDYADDNTALFTMTFIVHQSISDKTRIEGKNIRTREQRLDTSENNVINMDAINEALEKGLTPPAPVYGDLKENIDIYFENTGSQILINNPLSSNCYLKSAGFNEGSMYPSFSKLTTAYKVTIENDKKLEYSFIPEADTSQVSVSDEVNSQIVVTVTAENGETNSYVFTIVRTSAHQDPNDPNSNPDDPGTNPIDPVNPNPGRERNITMPLILIGIIALAFIGIGGYFVYQGSHIVVYEEEK